MLGYQGALVKEWSIGRLLPLSPLRGTVRDACPSLIYYFAISKWRPISVAACLNPAFTSIP